MNPRPQRSSRAIVTLVIGPHFQARWEKYCRENWERYARTCSADLIVVTEPLDPSARAAGRSPSWQKCLVPRLENLPGYQQIAWVDSDVLFNPHAGRNLFAGVPEGLVGAVSSFADPTPEGAAEHFRRVANWNRPKNTAPRPADTPEAVYRDYGLGVKALSQIFNAGVLVLSPRHHAELFQEVYERYEDRGDPSYYENVPLSYELVRRNLVYWMDPKFNHLWSISKTLHYPFLMDWRARSLSDKFLRRLAKWTGNNYEHRVAVACATSALLNCDVLHFAGFAREMEWIDMEAAIEGRVRHLGVR